MKKKKTISLFIFIFLILGLSGCLNKPNQLQMQSAQEIESLGKTCEDIAKLTIESWNARDTEKLREVYSEDIIHFDSGLVLEGVEEVVGMAEGILAEEKTWQMEAGDTYISQKECVDTWINWGMMDFSQENPGVEFDLLEIEGNQISFWRLFYDENFHFLPIDYDFLAAFENAWSTNNKDLVADMYSENATLQDTLFGINIEGRKAIVNYAHNFFDLSQGGSWTLIKAFSERREAPLQFKDEYPHPSLGGVFGINTTKPDGTNCEVRLVVILMPDANGKIQLQETFYNAETLVECGWVK